MRKRLVSLVLSMLLVLLLCPTPVVGAETVHQERLLEMPEGYGTPTAMSQLPGGGFAATALAGDGSWALLRWSDMDATPSVTPLVYQGNDIEHLSIAPDGSILAGLSPMPPMRAGSAGAEGGPRRMAPAGEPSTVQREDTVGATVQSGDAPAEGGEGPRLSVMGGIDELKIDLVWFDDSGIESARAQITGYAMSVQALNGQRAAVLTAQDGLGVYDAAGEQVTHIGLGRPITVTTDGENVYVLEEGKLVQYNSTTGETMGSIQVESNGSAALSWSGDGHVLLIDTTGLWDLDMSAGTQSLVASSMGTAFGDPNSAVTALASLNGNGYVALIDENGGTGGAGVSIRIGGEQNRLLAGYQAIDGLDPSQRADFTITALRSSARLQKAASDFQRLHPELNVILQAQMAADDESPTADHIRTLNTDLLAGEGGDVLVLDGLPADKYAQRGILSDLSGVFQDVDLLPGVRKGATGADGSMYAIPAQFRFDMLWGNRSNIELVGGLADLANVPLQSGQFPLAPRTYEALLDLFYPASEAVMRNEAGTLDLGSPQFAEFLSAVLALYDAQDEMPDTDIARDGRFDMMDTLSMMNGASAFFPARVSSLMDLAVGYSISGAENADCSTLPTLGGTSRGLIPSVRLGINARSSQKALAEEFIRLVLSPDIQLMEMGEGLPVLKSALDQQFEEAKERAESDNFMAMIAVGGGNPIQLSQPDAQVLDAIRALIDGLDEQIVPDETLMGFIKEECEALISGQRDATATASAIAQRAWSYLNE